MMGIFAPKVGNLIAISIEDMFSGYVAEDGSVGCCHGVGG